MKAEIEASAKKMRSDLQEMKNNMPAAKVLSNRSKEE